MHSFILDTMDWLWQIASYISEPLSVVFGEFLLPVALMALFGFLSYIVLWCWLFRSLFFTGVVMFYQARLGDQYFEDRQQGEHCHYLISKRFRTRWKLLWPVVYVLKYVFSLQALSLENSVLHFHHGTLMMNFRGVIPKFRAGVNVTNALRGSDRPS